MGEAFLYNLDEIVTRDFLDSRLAPVNARLDAIDARLDRMDTRFDGIDARLDRMDTRFDGIDARLNQIDQRLVEIDGKFRLIFWMQGMTIAVIVIPILTRFLI